MLTTLCPPPTAALATADATAIVDASAHAIVDAAADAIVDACAHAIVDANANAIVDACAYAHALKVQVDQFALLTPGIRWKRPWGLLPGGHYEREESSP